MSNRNRLDVVFTDCLIITGMSGAGKSVAVNALEDMGYYCVDNLPISLIPTFVERFSGNANRHPHVAFVADSRGDADFTPLTEIIAGIKASGIDCKLIFLDCADDVLINRYKETRRRHPLDVDNKGINEAIKQDRAIMESVRGIADYHIDTTALSSTGLSRHLRNLFAIGEKNTQMVITINTFGFKHGVPHESDMVFDVRFIRNPFYIPELKLRTGLEKEVIDFVFESDGSGLKFLEKAVDMLDFLIPLYINEGKTSLVISVGCTGGRHRSVAMGQALYDNLTGKGHNVVIKHRDLHMV